MIRFSAPQVVEDPDALPAVPGAYVLVIDLLSPVHLAGGTRIAPGRYAYAGSARGPGGIRARVRRHLRAAKKVHWHVDRLTNVSGVARVIALPGGGECAVLALLRGLPGAAVPVRGFGGSDCRTCEAHLLSLPDGFDPSGLAPLLAAYAPDGPPVIWRCPPAACFWRPPGPSR